MAARSRRHARATKQTAGSEPPTTAVDDLAIAESLDDLKAPQTRTSSRRLIGIVAVLVVMLLLISAVFVWNRSAPPKIGQTSNATVAAEIQELRAEIDALYVKRNNLLAEKARLELKLTTIQARIRELEEQL